MEDFKSEMAELLEVDSVQESDDLESFDAWDSLTILSIIAYVDEGFGVSISAQEVNDSKTIGGLYEFVRSKQV